MRNAIPVTIGIAVFALILAGLFLSGVLGGSGIFGPSQDLGIDSPDRLTMADAAGGDRRTVNASAADAPKKERTRPPKKSDAGEGAESKEPVETVEVDTGEAQALAAAAELAGHAPLGSGRVTIWGKVVDTEQNPISGATLRVVRISGDEVGSGASDREGMFQFDVPANARYLLRASAGGYASAEIAPLTLNGEGITIVLQSPYKLSGYVVDAASRDVPVTSFTVLVSTRETHESLRNNYDILLTQLEGKAKSSLYQEYKFASSDGYFEITNLPDTRRLMLIVRATGYLSAFEQVNAAQSDKEVLIRLSAGEEITGTVADQQTKAPLPGVAIQVLDYVGDLFDVVGEFQTDANGQFVILVPGKRASNVLQRVSFRKSGYGLLFRSIDDLKGGRRGNTIFMRPGGIIEAQVRFPDGAPVSGALIRVSDGRDLLPYAMGKTDAGGRFITEPLHPDNYNVTLYYEESVDPKNSYAAGNIIEKQEKTLVKSGETQVVNFEVSSGASLRGSFTIDGQPQVKAEVAVNNEGGWLEKKNYKSYTDTGGKYEVKNILPGDYSIRVESPEATVRASVSFPSGGSAVRDFTIKRIPVEGELVPTADVPVVPLQSFWRMDEPVGGYTYEAKVVIQEDRTFAAKLPAGVYTVTVKVQVKEYLIKNVAVTDGTFVTLFLDDTWMGKYHVTNSQDGKGITSGFDVNVQAWKGGQLLSNNKGGHKRSPMFYHQFDFEAADLYVLYFTAPGFSFYGPVEVTSSSLSAQEVMIPLTKGKTKLTVTVSGADSPSTVLVTLARVGEYGPFDWKYPGVGGSADFYSLDPGHYIVVGSVNGAQVAYGEITVQANDKNVELPLNVN